MREVFKALVALLVIALVTGYSAVAFGQTINQRTCNNETSTVDADVTAFSYEIALSEMRD